MIKKATTNDYETLCRLKRELLIYQNSVNPSNKCDEQRLISSDKMVRTYLQRSYSVYYIAFVEEKAVGFIHGTVDPKPQKHIQAYVQDLFVEEEHRNKGIGSDLLDELHTFFEEKDVTPGLSTDEGNPAIEWYKDRGYEISKTKDRVVYMIQEIY